MAILRSVRRTDAMKPLGRRPQATSLLFVSLVLALVLPANGLATTLGGKPVVSREQGPVGALLRPADEIPPIPLDDHTCGDYCCVDGLRFTIASPNPGWMAIALSPSANDNDFGVYYDLLEPPVATSTLSVGTDLVGMYCYQPSRSPYVVVATLGYDDDYVLEWTSQTGQLTPGTEVTGTMGGQYGDCGMVRIYGMSMDPGMIYRFILVSGGTDIRACVFPSNACNGWSSRSGALLEVQSGSPVMFSPTTGDYYGIAVFNNAPGNGNGTFYLRVDGYALGVDRGNAVLALQPTNPVVGAATARFSLAGWSPASLAVYDISGRRVVSREVGSGGPGWHTVQLGELPPGVYVVRLTQAGHRLSSRMTVIH